MLSPSRALMVGVPTLVGTGVNVAGTTQSTPFSILKSMAIDGQVGMQAVGGAFTVLNGNIEASMDGQVTWAKFSTFDFVLAPIQVITADAGVSYRLNFLNVTVTIAPNINALLS